MTAKLAAMASSTVWPLFSYSVSLACFGLLQVVVELRYVQARFATRLPNALWASCGAALAAIVCVRLLRLTGVVGALAGPLELALVAVLLAVGAAFASRIGAVVGVAVACVVGVGAFVAPVETLLVLAVLHNFTPLGFVIERAAPDKRVVTAVVASVVFVGAPLLVATGVPLSLAAPLVDLTRSFPSTPSLFETYPVYLWPSLVQHERALALFSAAVCAQLLHYVAVIVWLPATSTPTDRARLSLSWMAFAVVLLIVVGLVAHFAVDFVGARAVYSLVAAVHAWLELPVLLVALSRRT